MKHPNTYSSWKLKIDRSRKYKQYFYLSEWNMNFFDVNWVCIYYEHFSNSDWKFTKRLKYRFKAIMMYAFVFFIYLIFFFIFIFNTFSQHRWITIIWIIAESKPFANLSAMLVSALFRRILSHGQSTRWVFGIPASVPLGCGGGEGKVQWTWKHYCVTRAQLFFSPSNALSRFVSSHWPGDNFFFFFMIYNYSTRRRLISPTHRRRREDRKCFRRSTYNVCIRSVDAFPLDARRVLPTRVRRTLPTDVSSAVCEFTTRKSYCAIGAHALIFEKKSNCSPNSRAFVHRAVLRRLRVWRALDVAGVCEAGKVNWFTRITFAKKKKIEKESKLWTMISHGYPV